MHRWSLSLLLALTLTGCGWGNGEESAKKQADYDAIRLLGGVWTDDATGIVAMRAQNDTIFYTDSTRMPVKFSIYDDTIFLMGEREEKYAIVQQTEHVFAFRTPGGDTVTLTKDTGENTEFEMPTASKDVAVGTDQVVRKDTVLQFQGQRFHCYVYVNPTKYKVNIQEQTYDGLTVDNTYYDNIIHLSVFKGAERLFSRDIKKRAYRHLIPEDFLSGAILSDMELRHTDRQGFHFFATVCVPDGSSCYLIDNIVSPEGKLSTKVVE